MGDLQLFRTVGVGELQRVELPEEAWQVPTSLRSGPALNVGRAYLEFRAAITQGRPASPDFAAALARHHTLDCIERAANEGRRVELAA
jgi:predicted dehydrogenase